MAASPSPSGRYDTFIALAVIALFGAFLLGQLDSSGTDELHPLDDPSTSRAMVLGSADDQPQRMSREEHREVLEEETQEAYLRGVQETEARYDQELRDLRRRLAAYEAAFDKLQPQAY